MRKFSLSIEVKEKQLRNTQKGFKPDTPLESLIKVALNSLGIDGIYLLNLEEKKPNPGDCWGEHPNYPRSDWQREVENGDTQLDYWDWIEIEAQRR